MRIIHLSKDNQERITFTEDNAVPVEDMTPLGWDVVSDTEVDMETPNMFPCENTFEKIN